MGALCEQIELAGHANNASACLALVPALEDCLAQTRARIQAREVAP